MLARDALIGLILVVVGFAAAAWWDGRIADHQNQLARDIAENQDQAARGLATSNEILENTRFVRQVVIDNAAAKPFAGLNLASAALNGLDLACEDLAADPPTGCADLRGANLRGADLRFADLRNADLAGADLAGANLRGADLSGAHLSGAHLTGMCYDHNTMWPIGFTPPPPDCP